MSATFSLPPGFVVRPATLEDVPAITALANTCAIAETGVPGTTEDEVRNELGTPGLDLERDTWAIFTPDGKLVAHAAHWNIAEPRVRAYLFGRVHPEFCGRGLGTALLRLAEARACELIPDAPPDARITARGSFNATNKAAQALFENEGYTMTRTFLRMVIALETPPPAPQWPDGISIRTLRNRQDDLYTAYAANEEAFQDHWGHLPITFDKWQHWVEEDPDFDPTLWFLAMDGDEVAGTCFCRPHLPGEPDMGWVDDLGVRRPWRRRGIALALLLHAFGEFWRRGQRQVGLGVDATSLTGATRLYEKAGMRETRRYIQYEKTLRPGVELSTQAVD